MAQIQVKVRWRDIPVLDEARLSQVAGSSAFLRTKEPLPVGTMLIISPTANTEVRVPARVTTVIEIPEAGSDISQGMFVNFEAASELLEPYLDDEPAPMVGLAPEPAFDGPPDEEDEETGEPPDQRAAEPEPQQEDEGDLPAAPRVKVDLPGEEQAKKDSGLMPSVSGEINMSARRDSAADPDAPDKVIVLVDDAVPSESAAAPQQEAADGAESSPADDAGEGSSEESTADDAGKKKRKRRGRRRKKKK